MSLSLTVSKGTDESPYLNNRHIQLVTHWLRYFAVGILFAFPPCRVLSDTNTFVDRCFGVFTLAHKHRAFGWKEAKNDTKDRQRFPNVVKVEIAQRLDVALLHQALVKRRQRIQNGAQFLRRLLTAFAMFQKGGPANRTSCSKKCTFKAQGVARLQIVVEPVRKTKSDPIESDKKPANDAADEPGLFPIYQVAYSHSNLAIAVREWPNG